MWMKKRNLFRKREKVCTKVRLLGRIWQFMCKQTKGIQKHLSSAATQKCPKYAFKTDNRLMQVRSKELQNAPLKHSAILLTCTKLHVPLVRPLFRLFLSDRLRRVSVLTL